MENTISYINENLTIASFFNIILKVTPMIIGLTLVAIGFYVICYYTRSLYDKKWSRKKTKLYN